VGKDDSMFEEKRNKDFDTMKEMMTNIYDRLGTINNRMDIVEEAVTKSRLRDAKEALIKKLEHRKDVKFRKKKIKEQEKEKEKEEVLVKDKAYKELREEFSKAKKALGH